MRFLQALVIFQMKLVVPTVLLSVFIGGIGLSEIGRFYSFPSFSGVVPNLIGITIFVRMGVPL